MYNSAVQILHRIEQLLIQSAGHLPLEVSSFVGGLVEEVIAPIPSPFVMAAVGSAAYAQGKGFPVLCGLALLGSAGKTLGAWFLYLIADKLEDLLVGKLGRFLGVSHQDVEGIGKKFTGGRKDAWILFTLRALPIVPSSPVSVVAGIIKLNLRMYLLATLAGNFFRNLIYIYLGYSGISAYKSMLSKFDSAESIVQMGIFLTLAALVGWVYWKRRSA